MEAQLLEVDIPVLGTGNNPRSEGLHLTEVIRDLMVATGLSPKANDWNRESTMAAGFVWEEVLFSLWEPFLSSAFAALLGRAFNWHSTGEVTLDGIIGTPDGISISEQGLTLQEAKFTWKSFNSDPLDNFSYMTQCKSYCKMLGLTQVMLHVYHCMGDYRGSGPKYRPWLINYKPHEIEENWQMILNHAEHMRSK